MPCDAYDELKAQVEAITRALPLIGLLRCPAMRPRHWDELMDLCGHTFTRGSGFCLGDLLQMSLHRHEGAVRAIVARSEIELDMEGSIEEIAATWESLELEFVPSQLRESLQIIAVVQEVVDAYSDHQITLQTMRCSKGIQVFSSIIADWLRKLSQVEFVTGLLLSVQDSHQLLAPVYLNSEDARASLPDQTKRFDLIDDEWQASYYYSLDFS